MWPGLLMLKGVNRVDDALKAINYGVDGIIVSNHGGRNMDSAPATIRVLPEIAEAVGEKATVILDSGVRRGSDIVKALALGAKGGTDRTRDAVRDRGRRRGGGSQGYPGHPDRDGQNDGLTGCNRVDEISTDIFFGDREGNRLMAG